MYGLCNPQKKLQYHRFLFVNQDTVKQQFLNHPILPKEFGLGHHRHHRLYLFRRW
jgi:hypothetical protein